MPKTLDILIPCFNEQECVPIIYAEIENAISAVDGISWTVIYIDDGSSDETLAAVKALAKLHKNVKYISFSRNFGKESAIYAGLQSSHGDYVALIDADGQDPPSLLPQMLAYLNKGYDNVATRRVDRSGEPPVRSWFANRFYTLFNAYSDVQIKHGVRDYRLMTAQMRDAVLALSERERFSKGLFAWVGFKTKWLDIPNIERIAGKTKWSFFRLLKYAVSGMVAFSTTPLHLAGIIGFITVSLSVAYSLYRIIRYGVTAMPTDSIQIVLLLFIGGVIIIFLGVIGEYLARIYNEVKQRPLYFIKESNIADSREQDT